MFLVEHLITLIKQFKDKKKKVQKLLFKTILHCMISEYTYKNLLQILYISDLIVIADLVSVIISFLVTHILLNYVVTLCVVLLWKSS